MSKIAQKSQNHSIYTAILATFYSLELQCSPIHSILRLEIPQYIRLLLQISKNIKSIKLTPCNMSLAFIFLRLNQKYCIFHTFCTRIWLLVDSKLVFASKFIQTNQNCFIYVKESNIISQNLKLRQKLAIFGTFWLFLGLEKAQW